MEVPNVTSQKQRHGCVTVLLVLMLIGSFFAAIGNLFMKEMIISALPEISENSTILFLLLGIIGIVNIVFIVFLFQWKKIGFWGLLATSLVAFGLNIIIGLDFTQAIGGLVGPLILYAVLQIKSNNQSAWDNLV